MIDLAELSEDAVRDLPESEVLDFDEEHDLGSMLVDRLRALPYDRYLRLYASYLADIRDYLGADAGDEPGLVLLARTMEASRGGPVGSLLEDLGSYAGPEDELYGGALDQMLFFPCYELACELTTSEGRYGAAEAIAGSASQCVDDFVAGENLRLLMRFIIRTQQDERPTDVRPRIPERPNELS